MEGGGKEEGERGKQIDTCWRNVGEVAASETGEERDREGVCGLVKGTQGVPAWILTNGKDDFIKKEQEERG